MYIKEIDVVPQKICNDETIMEKVKQNFHVLLKERENGKQLLIVLCVFIYPLIIGYPFGKKIEFN